MKPPIITLSPVCTRLRVLMLPKYDVGNVGQLNEIRSKSGVQLPTIGLENSSVLQPVFKTTVVCI